MAKRSDKTKEKKPTTGEKVHINVKFTADEAIAKGRELTRALQLIEEKEEQVKAAVASARAEIKQHKSDAKELANQLTNGYERREVDALVTFHRKSGVKTYTRHCPGQPGHGDHIKKVEMTEEDYAILPNTDPMHVIEDPESKPPPHGDAGGDMEPPPPEDL
jgi:hypothetical protein